MLKEVRKLLGVINYFEWGFDIVESDDGKIMMSIIFHNEMFDLHVEDNASDEDKKLIEEVIGCIYKDAGNEGYIFGITSEDMMIELIDKVK